MLLANIVKASRQVGETSKRLEKTALASRGDEGVDGRGDGSGGRVSFGNTAAGPDGDWLCDTACGDA